MPQDVQYYTDRIEKAMKEHSIHSSHFGKSIWDTLKLTDVEVKEDAGRKSCKVVIETVVTRGMYWTGSGHERELMGRTM